MKTAMLIFCLGALLILPGCLRPPEGTVWLDTDANGDPDILAMDQDRDGVADVDEAGKVKPAVDPKTMERLQIALKADEYGPATLSALGAIIGLPILTAIGFGWKAGKWGRVFANTVLSIQAARKALKDGGKSAALEVVDAELFRVQTDEAARAVAKAKLNAGVVSVT